jgi:hypothetical protein
MPLLIRKEGRCLMALSMSEEPSLVPLGALPDFMDWRVPGRDLQLAMRPKFLKYKMRSWGIMLKKFRGCQKVER